MRRSVRAVTVLKKRAPSPGPELWPQPAYAASAGLTLLNGTVTGGAFVGDASGAAARAIASSPPTIAAGQTYQYTVTVAANPSGGRVGVNIGGTAKTITTGTGTFTGTVTVGASPSQVMRAEDLDNLGATRITATSIKLLS